MEGVSFHIIRQLSPQLAVTACVELMILETEHTKTKVMDVVQRVYDTIGIFSLAMMILKMIFLELYQNKLDRERHTNMK